MEQLSQMNIDKTVLITGASGFIGSFLLDEAIGRGLRVFAAVRKSTDLSIFKTRKVELVTVDYSDPISMIHTFSGLPRFDFVIHNAGITKSIRTTDFLKINYAYTKNLILALSEPSLVPDKFLFVSSLAARGPVINGESSSESNPQTLYGKSKLIAEDYIRSQENLNYIIIRPTAVYGPGDKDFLKALKLMKYGIDLRIGTSDRKLTFIYVKDLAQLVLDAVLSDQVNKTYLATDGNLYSQMDFGNNAALAFNRNYRSIGVPYPLAKLVAACGSLYSGLTGKSSVVNNDNIIDLSANDWSCDITPAITELGFCAEYDLRKGLEETVNWYSVNGWL